VSAFKSFEIAGGSEAALRRVVDVVYEREYGIASATCISMQFVAASVRDSCSHLQFAAVSSTGSLIQRSQPEDAACLGTIVDRLLAAAGSQLARTEKELHDETQTLLSEQLDPEQPARLQVAAEAMSIEEATDYAFRSLAASPVLTE
jgi:hypothetical protein